MAKKLFDETYEMAAMIVNPTHLPPSRCKRKRQPPGRPPELLVLQLSLHQEIRLQT
jgi:hypothetical protein